MPPPASFIVIGSIPFTQLVTIAMFNVANEQWFKYVATEPIVLGIQTTAGGTFSPYTTVTEDDGTTVVPKITDGVFGNWHALVAAGDYYIQVIKSGTGPTDSDFTFTANTKPLEVADLIIGDIIVNDDAENFPAVVLSSAGSVKFYVPGSTGIFGIPGGETGAILPSNTSFWHDFYGQIDAANRIAVFNPSLVYVTSVACGLTGSNKPRFATDVTNGKVYVVNQARELWTITAAGVATNTGYTFPIAPTPFSDVIAVNEDGTKLYWATVYGKVGVIHAVDLSTLTNLPDFFTIPGFTDTDDSIALTPYGHPGDMFVMSDGAVVTWWYEDATTEYHLIVVNSAGTLLYQYDYADPTSIDHLAYVSGSSTHIMVWFFTDSTALNVARFGRLALATGVVDQDFEINTFEEGVNETSTEKFGPSSSCTFFRYQTSLSGIYFVDPTKIHDTYNGSVTKKIPNPTIRTALLGE